MSAMAYNLDMVLNFQIRDPTDEDPQRYRMYARNKLEEWMADGLPTKGTSIISYRSLANQVSQKVFSMT